MLAIFKLYTFVVRLDTQGLASGTQQLGKNIRNWKLTSVYEDYLILTQWSKGDLGELGLSGSAWTELYGAYCQSWTVGSTRG